jgi:hypothetical protein
MKKILSWLKVIWPVAVADVKKGTVAFVAGTVALVAKVKTIKWTKAKLVALGIVVALVAVTMITAKLVKRKQQQPVATTTAKTTVKKVVENPTVKQIAKADTVIIEQASIKASGTVKVKAKTAATAKESKAQYTIPLSGTANTMYTDSAGATVGQGTRQVTGQANVTVTDTAATADVTINDTSQVAMTVKREQRKHEVGGYAGIAAGGDAYLYAGGYYQRNLPIITTKKIDVAGFGRVSAEKRWGADDDLEGRATVGIKAEF